jgi:hypothetical protein
MNRKLNGLRDSDEFQMGFLFALFPVAKKG